MKRLLPKTLTSQLNALVLGAIVMTLALCISFFTGEREFAITAANARIAIMHITIVADRIEAGTLSGQSKDILEGGYFGQDIRLELSDQPTGQQNLAEARDIFWNDHQQGQYLTDREILMGVVDRPSLFSRIFSQVTGVSSLCVLQVSVQLNDGRWLNGAVDVPAPPFRWFWHGFLSAVMITSVLLGVIWFLVTRVSGPLRQLALTASLVGGRDQPLQLVQSCPHELKPLTLAFNDMVRRLTLLLRERSQMLAAIGHDLRSPITAMRIRIEMLDDVKAQDRLTACLDEIEQLVQGALMLSRGTDTGEVASHFPVNELLEEIKFEFGECEKPVFFDSSVEYNVLARRAALKRSLRNLVDNAIRYGGFADISCEGYGDRLVISIADGGPGIPPEESERIFEPFVRLETSRSRDTGGTGLGMTIAKSTIISHGGIVELKRNLKDQFIVVVSLPILTFA
jgi:signal transduction histidine kinase